jgi:hypothetical protein
VSIKARAGRILMFVRNRPTATPPIVFQNFDSNSNFSFSIWLKPDTTQNTDYMLSYGGQGGDFILQYTNRQWFITPTTGSIVLPSIYLTDVAPLDHFNEAVWQVFCISKVGNNVKVYSGTDNPLANPRVPVVTNLVADFDVNYSYQFFQFHLAPSHNTAMCNVKYWNTALTKAQFDDQVNRWNPVGSGPLPMWCSPLRSPGDISNIANPYTSTNWDLGHSYETVYPFPNDFEHHVDDPSYLAYLVPCSVWVQTLGTFNRNTAVTFNPGSVPINLITYKSIEFLEFEDRGALIWPTHSNPNLHFQSVVYYAFPFTTGTGFGPSDSYPLLHDETGVEVATPIDPAHRFEVNTGVDISGLTGMTILTLFSWRYGGQFTWQPQPGGGQAATANLGYARLLITNTGFPVGFPTGVNFGNLTGLFVVTPGQRTDLYNRNTEVRIPDPTIRTAYIGE